MEPENNFNWKHLVGMVAVVGVVAAAIIGCFGLIAAKADKTTVDKIVSTVLQKADKTEVIRVETQVKCQIQEVKKDLQKDIGAVQQKLDKIYDHMLGSPS